VAFASSLDQIGPFSGTVEDSALVLETIAGHDPLDSTSIFQPAPSLIGAAADGVDGLRVGIVGELMDGVAADVGARVEEAARSLEKAGAVVSEAAVPAARYGLSAYSPIAAAAASRNLARHHGAR